MVKPNFRLEDTQEATTDLSSMDAQILSSTLLRQSIPGNERTFCLTNKYTCDSDCRCDSDCKRYCHCVSDRPKCKCDDYCACTGENFNEKGM